MVTPQSPDPPHPRPEQTPRGSWWGAGARPSGVETAQPSPRTLRNPYRGRKANGQSVLNARMELVNVDKAREGGLPQHRQEHEAGLCRMRRKSTKKRWTVAKASETPGSSEGGRGGSGMGVGGRPRGGPAHTLTWSSWHGGDQGPPPLPPVDPGAENHRDHVENVQAQVTCGRGTRHQVASWLQSPGSRAAVPLLEPVVAAVCVHPAQCQ